MILAATAARITYAVLVDVGLSGPDAPTYHQAAVDMAAKGLLAEQVTGIPYWPAGYPTFVALVYLAVGQASPAAVGIVQAVVLGGASWVLYRLVSREFDPTVAAVSVVLVSSSPGLLAASAQLMYEPLLVAGLVAGFAMCSASARRGSHGWGIAAMAVLGVTATMQPRVLFAAAVALVWLAWHHRRVTATALAVAAVALGPLALAVRNQVVVGRPVLADNTAVAVRNGWNDDATGAYVVQPGGGGCPRPSSSLLMCSAGWIAAHPAAAARLAVAKAVNFWAPLTGPLNHGTWFHAFDYRRLVVPPRGIGQVLEALRAAAVVMLTLWGTAIGLRRAPWRTSTVVFTAVVAAFMLVSVASIGDPRMRLPVAPFYSTLMAIAVVDTARRLSPIRARLKRA